MPLELAFKPALELIKGHVIIGSTQLQNAFSENH